MLLIFRHIDMKNLQAEVKSRESSHNNDGPLASSVLLGLEGSSSSGRKPLSPSDTSIDESVKSAHAGKEVTRVDFFKS